jgi:hypothetical protein
MYTYMIHGVLLPLLLCVLFQLWKIELDYNKTFVVPMVKTCTIPG